MSLPFLPPNPPICESPGVSDPSGQEAVPASDATGASSQPSWLFRGFYQKAFPYLKLSLGLPLRVEPIGELTPPRMRLLISEPAGEPEVAQLWATLRGQQGRRRPSRLLWSLCVCVSRAAALPRPASCHVSSACVPRVPDA